MIDVQDLRFTYPGTGTPTLQGLNFAIQNGEVYGLLGPSGAGKSTTQKILMGLLHGHQGQVAIFGEPLKKLGRAYYERIGVSFELPTLYLRLTARENLALFAALYDSPTRDPLDLLNMVDMADAADQRVDTFSKGMKMRLNLCRALVQDPDLLFLDEPTTGQDPARARITRELILRLKSEGKTIFLTTHNMAEADEICDRVGFLSHGHIPVTGKPEDLKRQYGERLLHVDARTGDNDSDAIQRHEFAMDRLNQNQPFLDLLNNDRIVSMHTMEASLDDVFIKATGAKGGA